MPSVQYLLMYAALDVPVSFKEGPDPHERLGFLRAAQLSAETIIVCSDCICSCNCMWLAEPVLVLVVTCASVGPTSQCLSGTG